MGSPAKQTLKRFHLINYYYKESEIEKAEIKIAERDKILATVSHKIKGLIHSIQTPLTNMLEWAENPQGIKNALKGTVLISDLVNTASQSYTAKIDDFYHDVRKNEGGDTLESIILDSVKYSIPHMFDGKNYNKQNRNYFKTEEEHVEAQKKWYAISDSDALDPINNYLRKYFFKTDFDISAASKYRIGNDKGSASRLVSIFQELIFNAIKNASYLKKDARSVKISIKIDRSIIFKVSNSYDPDRRVKTTALGNVIVKNIIESVDGELSIDKDDTIFVVKVILPNFWEKK